LVAVSRSPAITHSRELVERFLASIGSDQLRGATPLLRLVLPSTVTVCICITLGG
jgi:hypothetical protein